LTWGLIPTGSALALGHSEHFLVTKLVSSVDRKPGQRFLAEPVGGQLAKSGGVDTETTGWAFGSNVRNAIRKRSLASIDSRQY
jgi:hypothetical protein